MTRICGHCRKPIRRESVAWKYAVYHPSCLRKKRGEYQKDYRRRQVVKTGPTKGQVNREAEKQKRREWWAARKNRLEAVAEG